MRRSYREATIGFSLLVALVGGIGLWFWLSGVVFGRKTWNLRLRFSDAAGLSQQSTVTFRGVAVGTVREVRPHGNGVDVVAQINDPSLLLPRPLVAQVRSGSLLGGDPQIALESMAQSFPAGVAGPLDSRCNPTLIVCANGLVQGVPTPSLTSVMGLMQNLLAKTDKENLITKVSNTTTELGATSKAFRRTASKADTMLSSSDQLVRQLQQSVREATPVIANLRQATAEAKTTMINANAAAVHARNITAAFDNPQTIHELKRTISNAEQLTRKADAIGGDVQKLSGDPNFVEGMRSVTIGLGRFFDELYPDLKRSESKRPDPKR